MSSEIAIKVENLSKCYHIYANPRDRLKQFILPRAQRVLGVTAQNHYREFWALRDVSFEVKKGETVGIVGGNGSGKSTLLQMICGTLNATTGTIQARGRIAALLELGSGFNPEFTGRENVYLNGAVLGLSHEEIEARFDDIASFADIGDFIERPVKTYSSGMYVRLAFAVQAMVDPDIFVVDEALAVGDEKFQRKCFVRLEELKSRGASILFVSHSAPSIIELCDKTLLLHHGTRLMFGQPAEAIRAYQKLIYAPEEEQKRLAEAYQLADQSGSMPEIETTPDESPTETSRRSSDNFDSGLVPDTTTVYPVQGAEIESIRILDASGCEVNLLEHRENYQVVMSGRFLQQFAGVFFAIHIKSVSGMLITGQRYPEEGAFVHEAQAGKSFTIRFGFKMDLLPGTYFVGGGIWSSQEPECAHRILDALMFRVLPKEKSRTYGFIDMSAAAPDMELS